MRQENITSPFLKIVITNVYKEIHKIWCGFGNYVDLATKHSYVLLKELGAVHCISLICAECIKYLLDVHYTQLIHKNYKVKHHFHP